MWCQLQPHQRRVRQMRLDTQILDLNIFYLGSTARCRNLKVSTLEGIGLPTLSSINSQLQLPHAVIYLQRISDLNLPEGESNLIQTWTRASSSSEAPWKVLFLSAAAFIPSRNKEYSDVVEWRMRWSLTPGTVISSTLTDECRILHIRQSHLGWKSFTSFAFHPYFNC